MVGTLTVATLAVGCRDKSETVETKPTTAPATAPATPPAEEPRATPPARKDELAAGETIWKGSEGKETRATWTPKPGKEVELYVVRRGEADSKGVLRARSGTKRYDVADFTLDKGKGDAEVTLKPLDNGRALFWYTPDATGSDRNRSRLLVLTYDDEADKVHLHKSWAGRAGAKMPAWAASGELKFTEDAAGACEAVARKMVACRKDPAFKDALVTRLDTAGRTETERYLTSQLPRLKDKKAFRRQCEDWATGPYRETHLADPEELAELAKDAQSDCATFGRELVDEGGLPLPQRKEPARL